VRPRNKCVKQQSIEFVDTHLSHSVGLVQRGYSIPSPVLLKCCVASVIAQSVVLYRTCTGLPAVWGCLAELDPL